MPSSVEQVIVNVAVFLIVAALVVFGRWLRQTKHTLDDAHEMLGEVNHAVNNRPKGDPTIYEVVLDVQAAAHEAKITAAHAVDRLDQHAADDKASFADLRARLDCKIPDPEP